ncbi:hypothetical protein BY458DRAFT_477061 [Sporodiniella umbellata]|nr:hypothetical protein BY458DRAFT_477061 [Sporodiniella umbellata]
MLIFTSLIGLLGSFYKQRKSIHILYTTTVVITFIYQLSIAIIVHVQAINSTSWVGQTWTESSNEYRLYAQTKFDCCGFTNPSDHPFPSDTCVAQLNSSLPPCYEPLNQYIQQELGRVSIGLFVALVFTIFALINSITSFYAIRSKRSWEVGLESTYEHKRQLTQRHSSSETLIYTVTPTLK